MTEDYTDIIMDDVYDLLISYKNPWPKNYTKVQKLEFLDKLISYFEENEYYEKCDKIKYIKQRIKDDKRISKNKKEKR
jgi:hypothetical protein